MENEGTEPVVVASELRATYAAHDGQRPEAPQGREAGRELKTLHIAVGTNLADVERWMIFATLQKCGGNKTRAAALLGVSLKTLYNRLNAYRAQGLAMDYDAGEPDNEVDRLERMHPRGDDLHGELT
jgi:Response regulator containing CheY-like receiver, AAA-type ATPase, and DNA-binding domains